MINTQHIFSNSDLEIQDADHPGLDDTTLPIDTYISNDKQEFVKYKLPNDSNFLRVKMYLLDNTPDSVNVKHIPMLADGQDKILLERKHKEQILGCKRL